MNLLEAAQQLAQYIQQVDEQTAKELALDLKDNIKQQITSPNDSLKTGESCSGAERSGALNRISGGLKNAEAGENYHPQIQQTQDVTQETMFLLGSEALKSMIDNEASSSAGLPVRIIRPNKTCWILRRLNV